MTTGSGSGYLEGSGSNRLRMPQGPEAHGRPKTEQTRLKRIMKGELGGHTWQFPATEFIKMLSPRMLKDPSSPMNRSRSDFNFEVDKSFFREALKKAVENWKKNYEDDLTCLEKGKRTPWPRNAPERQYNAPVAKLMNTAFCICHDALSSTEGAPTRRERYLDKTVFLNYDRPTGDIMPGSAGALEPDVIGGNLDLDLENRVIKLKTKPKRGAKVGKGKRETKKTQKPAFWGPEKEEKNRIREVLELKALWPELVQQGATYASHTQTRFRCLIFHRSGLTASLGYHPAQDADEFLSIIMTMLLWTSPSHAGFDPTIDGTEFFLPTSKDDHMGVKWTDAECIYSAVVVRGRATRVHRLLPPNDPSWTQQGSTIQPSPFAAVYGLPRCSARLMMSNTAYELAESPGDSGGVDGDEDDDEHSDYKEDEGKRGVPIVQQRHEVTFHQPKSSSFLEEMNLSKLPSSVVFKSQWVEDSRKDVEKTMYEDLASKHLDFGVGVLLATWEATYTNGEAQSTAIFLPEPVEKEERHWHLFANCPDSIEIRSAQCFISETVGRPIEHVTKSLDLFVILAHALLGWLNVYQAGHLHRDISIGNVLEIIEPQSRTLPTIDLVRQCRAAALELEGLGLDKTIGKVSAFNERLEKLGRQLETLSLEDQQENAHIVKIRQQLDNATLLRETVDKVTSCVENLEYQLKNNKHVDGRCRGFLVDGDMSKAWANIFNNLEDKKVVGERSGTRQFMSTDLLNSLEIRGQYLQSPIDDLESFFHVAVWAVLYNSHTELQNPIEQLWRDGLNGDRYHRGTVTTSLMNLQRMSRGSLLKQGYSAIVAEAAPFLFQWHDSLLDLRADWWQVKFEADELQEYLSKKVGDAAKEKRILGWFWMSRWHEFALRGVVDYLKCLADRAPKLEEYPPFNNNM